MKSGGMIRKQVYIEPRHDRMLKRRASQRGVTEAELIREALDGAEMGVLPGRRDVDASAGRKALAFMRSLSASHTGGSRRRTWTRDSLYEERTGRWTKS
jgi:hypothetical protein